MGKGSSSGSSTPASGRNIRLSRIPTPPASPTAAPPGGYPCEFGNDAHDPLDAAFTCNNKLIGAYQMLGTYRAIIGAEADEFDSARDNSGHGTHTSSTAAGNRGVEASVQGSDLGLVSGMAPRAHVIMYKGLGKRGGFGSDLGAAIDQAVADGVDVFQTCVKPASFANVLLAGERCMLTKLHRPRARTLGTWRAHLLFPASDARDRTLLITDLITYRQPLLIPPFATFSGISPRA